MAELHPAATHHLPGFITAPGGTDVLMVVMGIILLLAVMGFGILFLRLHSLPERMAHRTHKIQFEIVAVLCLIALFTHMHIFWIAALLLAMIDLPDFGTSLNRIAGSAEKLAGLKPGEGAVDITRQPPVAGEHAGTSAEVRPEHSALPKTGDGAPGPAARPEIAPAKQKEPLHA